MMFSTTSTALPDRIEPDRPVLRAPIAIGCGTGARREGERRG